MNELTELQQAILSIMTDGRQRSQLEICNLLAVHGWERDDVVDALDEIAKTPVDIQEQVLGDLVLMDRSGADEPRYQMKHD